MRVGLVTTYNQQQKSLNLFVLYHLYTRLSGKTQGSLKHRIRHKPCTYKQSSGNIPATMKFLKLINNLAFAGVVLCLPKATVPRALSRRDGTAADTLIIIMPDSASCSGRGDECVTADVAAPFLVESMEKYKVSTGKEQAGILALIAYESQQLRYKKNLLHSADGQGTANE